MQWIFKRFSYQMTFIKYLDGLGRMDLAGMDLLAGTDLAGSTWEARLAHCDLSLFEAE
jgi:hypothetical protein